MSESVTVRRAESIDDYRACQAAQRRAWGIGEDGYVVPVATMVGAQLHGGLVLGAFLASGEAVGLSFAFLGRSEGRPCLYSQLTGVVPDFQGKGIGLRLKQVQWEFARSQGLELLAWAFDPLQSGNAHFNFEKLGATAGRYVEDMYGPRTDSLNAGVPTDRLIAEWATSPRVSHGLTPESARDLPRLIDTTLRPDGPPAVGGTITQPTAVRTLLEIPESIQRLRGEDPATAQLWTLAVRRAFRDAFALGYRAVGFLRVDGHGRRLCYYLLERA
jgi:predicted GNAT superfamily acetyltransferase